MNTKNKIRIFALAIVGMLLMVMNGCKKENTNTPPVPVPVPVLLTSAISTIRDSTAICGGKITSYMDPRITSKGVCWSTEQGPTIANNRTMDGTGDLIYPSLITGLLPNTTYYVRAYATNSSGTGYGNELKFKTYNATITDIDGNIYCVVAIGSQMWLAQNLRVTHYRNGDPIYKSNGSFQFDKATYCEYMNADGIKLDYDKLYNWNAIKEDRKIAPIGWHVPSDEEWATLTNYLGGKYVAGGKLKETGLEHWKNPNKGATNVTGFTALPGGYCSGDNFSAYGVYGVWWSSTEYGAAGIAVRTLFHDTEILEREILGNYFGLSVRCIKD